MLAVEICRREEELLFYYQFIQLFPRNKTYNDQFLMIDDRRTFHDGPGSLHHSSLYLTKFNKSSVNNKLEIFLYFLPATGWFNLYLMFLSPQPGLWFLFLFLFGPPLSLLDDGVRRLEILQDGGASSHH